jgi:glutamate racemase
MLKVVVFDSGWGGEAFANYLESELPIVEVIRVIDWRHAPYNKLSVKDVLDCTEKSLSPYFGNVDVIILASYEATISSLEYLRKKYPKQKFLGVNFEILKEDSGTKFLILTTSFVTKSRFYLEQKENLPNKDLLEVICDDWPQLIDDGELTKAMIKEKMDKVRDIYSDAVVLGCTQFSDVQDDLAEVISWKQGRIIDEFTLILKNLCHTLKLRGGDGKRKK